MISFSILYLSLYQIMKCQLHSFLLKFEQKISKQPKEIEDVLHPVRIPSQKAQPVYYAVSLLEVKFLGAHSCEPLFESSSTRCTSFFFTLLSPTWGLDLELLDTLGWYPAESTKKLSWLSQDIPLLLWLFDGQPFKFQS